MTETGPQPTHAREKTYIARCPINKSAFSGAYVFATPEPPILLGSPSRGFQWNYGCHVLTARAFHKIFCGLRLTPSEGPRLVALKVKPSTEPCWLVRYPPDAAMSALNYAIALGAKPVLRTNRRNIPNWSNIETCFQLGAFHNMFPGVRLPPGGGPVQVSFTVDPIDARADDPYHRNHATSHQNISSLNK